MNVGDTLRLEAPEIDRTLLALYAGASGDHNRPHIDTDAAKAAGFPDVFAHGMLSMAFLGRLVTDLVPQQQVLSYSVRFGAITPVHAAPICTGTVTSIEDGVAHLDLRVALVDGTVTLTGEANVKIDGGN